MSQITNNCPVCGERASMSARCPMQQSGCDNGHEWYQCPRHGYVKFIGMAPTGTGFDCICHQPEEGIGMTIRTPFTPDKSR
jgi:hypothetical protein